MKRKILTTITIIIFLTGVGFLAFPFVSNWWGAEVANDIVEKIDENIENIVEGSFEKAYEEKKVDKERYPIDENGQRTSQTPLLFLEDITKLQEEVIEYNEKLKQEQVSLLVNDYAYTVPSIDLTKYGIYDGVFGYIKAPYINLQLPIYLGASDYNMSYGAAHLTHTSLPLGGESTNTVLAGHTNYIGRIFFDNLRNMPIGEKIIITTYLGETTYKVSEIKIVQSDEASDIFIKPHEDLLTLITCVGTTSDDLDRYLIICKRVD